jgi:hypothetical protein
MKHTIGLNLIFGVWLLVSPFAFGFASSAAAWNDVIAGARDHRLCVVCRGRGNRIRDV